MILSLLRYLYRRYVKSKKKKEDKKEDSDWHSYFLFRLRLGFAGVLACLTVHWREVMIVYDCVPVVD